MSKGEDITTRYKLDISDLKKGITEANKNIKLANAEFKAASAGMDDWQKSSDGITSKLKQLKSVLVEENSKLENYKKQLSEVEKASSENGKRADELKSKLNQLASQGISKTSEEYKKYEKQLNDVEKEQITNENVADKLRITILNQQATVNKTEKEIRNYSTALDNLENESGQAEDAIEELDKSIKESKKSTEKANSEFTIMKGTLANLVADGIKSALSSLKELLNESFKLAESTKKASNIFITQTGISKDSAEDFENVMMSIYKNNFGDNLEDIAESMALVNKNLGTMNPDILQEATQNAILLRDTFGYDINESTRTASMLMQQFGIDATEAYNAIVVGSQNGINKNGDLLDTLNEYSVHYKQLGLDVNDMLNMLVSGTYSGTFSVDKLGDAVKEFGIRAKDTSNTTTEGFKLIGLNADEMRKKFAEGGDTAKQATSQTLNALFSLDDQVKQNQAGVDLFGTMWEDLGKDGVQALMDLSAENVVAGNELEELNKIKYNDVENALNEVKRNLISAVSEPISNEVLPALNSLVQNINWEQFGQKVGDAIGKIVDVFKWIIDNGDTIISILAGIAAGFVAFKIVRYYYFPSWSISNFLRCN